ncbi:MAG TPA: hypothetical protein VMI06_02370 [Terriglobia bacterium]|nr:hypothetical protein [Terriglobia bacterium]
MLRRTEDGQLEALDKFLGAYLGSPSADGQLESFDKILESYLRGPSAEFTVNFPEVNLGLIPGRGFLYSLILYAVVIPILIFLPVSRTLSHYEPAEQWKVTTLSKDTIFLPQLGGGSSGGITSGESAESPVTARPTTAAVTSKTGVTYPGAQTIVSNPPNPTNRVQTILQPGLKHRPTLKELVPLPNIVKMVALSPSQALPGSLEAPEPVPQPVDKPDDRSAEAMVSAQMPVLPIGVLAPVEHPKLSMPAEAPPAATNVPLQALLKPLVPPEPKPAYAKPQVLPGVLGRDDRDLLVLSVTPARSSSVIRIPKAESRGQFAIAALPLLAMSNVGPGSQTASAAATSVAVGTHPKNPVRDAAGSQRENAAAGRNPLPGGGKLGEASKWAGGGSAPAPAGSAGSGGMAAGNSAGSAAGSGFGTSVASGSGAGSGAGGGAFPGITIQGGEGSPGQISGQAGPRSGATESVQYGSYDLTIVSNGDSGGGLKDFGIFTGEQVFSVYVNVPGDPGRSDRPWILEYAQMRGGSDPVGELQPPFPRKKEAPQWPVELSTRYRGQLMVIYGVIGRNGKLLNMRMMQTPNPELNQPLFKALQQWLFSPARMNGQPVAVEILLGVPLVGSQ